MRLAIDEVNSSGGVLGRKLELITEDDRSVTEEARSAAQKLMQRDGVVALLGEVASSRSMAAAPEAQRASIPMISPASTNTKVTEVGDYVFRTCFIDPFQGAVMARFAFSELGAQARRDPVRLQAGLLGRARRRRSARSSASWAARSSADERYTSGDIEFRAQLTTIRGAAPDAIFVPGYYTELGLIAKQARELGLTVPLLGGDGWDSREDARDRRHRGRGLLLLDPLLRGVRRPARAGVRAALQGPLRRRARRHGRARLRRRALLADAIAPRGQHRAAPRCATRSPPRATSPA